MGGREGDTWRDTRRERAGERHRERQREAEVETETEKQRERGESLFIRESVFSWSWGERGKLSVEVKVRMCVARWPLSLFVSLASSLGPCLL